MIRGGKKAFTIIEVLLFVAISGALIMITMTTIGSKQHRVQFTDSMRSLESFVESQRSATRNGVNDNPTECGSSGTGGNSESCIILGRIMVFGLEDNTDPTKIEYRVLTGDRISADQEAACGIYTLECSNPTTETSARDVDIVWGSRFVRGSHMIGGVPEPSRAFGFVRDPRSSEVNVITYSDVTANVITNTINDDNTYGNNPDAVFGADVDAYYCFESSTGQLDAVIEIIDTDVNLIFDPPTGAFSC